jgi:hypothetical protein
MVRFALASLSAAALVAGCYTERYPGEGPGHDQPVLAPVTQGAAVTSSNGAPVLSSADTNAPLYRVGFGTVEAVSMVPGGSAAAGGTVVVPRGYELRIHMDDNSMQNIVQDNPNFRVGDRVEVTSNRIVLR